MKKKKKIVATGHHFKIDSFIIASIKKSTDISCPNGHVIDKVHTFRFLIKLGYQSIITEVK